MKLTRKQFCILEALYGYEDGSVFDASGYAMARLFAAVRHNTRGTTIKWGDNISGILACLEENKLLRREINGKRTYRIRISPKGVMALRESDRLGAEPKLCDDRRTLGVIEHIKSRLDDGWTASVIDSADNYEIFVLKAGHTTTQGRKLNKVREMMSALNDGRFTVPEFLNEIHNIVE